MLKLATDPEADVRRSAVYALEVQRAEPDVQAAIRKLLRDSSPAVVYSTILADGPTRHRRELESLVKCADAEIAGWAKDQIKSLEHPAK